MQSKSTINYIKYRCRVNPTFDVDLVGTYVLSLVVNDGTVNSDPDVVSISTLNRSPVALADGPFLGYEGSPVNMDASSSYDLDGDILTYHWDFGDGTTLNTMEDSIDHIYETAGEYAVVLVVNDGKLDSKTPFSTHARIGAVRNGPGKGVDTFLSYVSPVVKKTYLPNGTTSFEVKIIYGQTIHIDTFEATLNKEPFSAFNPDAGTSENVYIPLTRGRNTLTLAVDGVREDGRIATDRDRLVFIVK